MPDDLADYVEKHQNLSNKTETEYVKEQIEKYKQFLQVKAYRPSKKGSEVGEVDGNEGESKSGTGKGRGPGSLQTSLVLGAHPFI